MASFFSITAEMVGGVALERGGLFGGVVVRDFLDPRLTGGRGGAPCATCLLGCRLEGGIGGGMFPFAIPEGDGGTKFCEFR